MTDYDPLVRSRHPVTPRGELDGPIAVDAPAGTLPTLNGAAR